MKTMLRFTMLLLALSGVAFSAHAQSAKPDPTKIPALQPFLKEEGHAYFMGQDAGLNGWFIMMSNNRIQIAYTSLDGENVIVGAIFGADGSNVTEQQIIAVRQAEPEVNKLFTDTVEQAKANMVKSSGMDRILSGLDPTKKGDQLYLDLAQTVNITIGPKDGNLLFMFIDPNCPHCKHAWKEMTPLLKKYNMQVRLIPIGILGDDSTRMAGVLLDDNDTAKLAAKWQSFAASDFNPDKLNGTPSADGVAKVNMNRAIFDRWKLKATPFIAYRSKTGGVKIVNAVPKDMEALFADVAPVAPAEPAKPVAK